ncbi:MAG TPA: PIN domain-containing protein, partial [Candidatus Acidoferrales bacterium]|nr:PIN domain-containing protein [Candidatus Acidoferrales bacterium]
MAIKVLDSHALLTFFQGEAGADDVEKLLLRAQSGAHRLLLCVVNWGEVYYTTMRRISPQAAEEKAREIAA